MRTAAVQPRILSKKNIFHLYINGGTQERKFNFIKIIFHLHIRVCNLTRTRVCNLTRTRVCNLTRIRVCNLTRTRVCNLISIRVCYLYYTLTYTRV